MELRTTREMRRNERLSKVMAGKAEDRAESAPAQVPAAPRPQAPTDKLSVSAQALAWVDEQNQKRWEWEQERQQRKQNRAGDMLSSLDAGKRELDALAKAMDTLEKCRKIAASIMKGDKVPPEDMEYLMNNDPDGFKLAMAMRREKKDPEDCESVLDEEDRQGASKASRSGKEAPSVEAAGASSGGGEAPSAAE